MKPDYRSEIDGLRAVAVMPVILFHAGVPGFNGGFIGVDIFFVISGFLITTIIAAEIDRDKFTLMNFYERRIRRIFPALLLVLLTVMILSVLFLLPSQFREVPETIIGTIFFVSNIVFYNMSGYFTAAAETKPLLHTWSLGVEEQFYIFFPILLMLVARYAPDLRNWIVAICAGASFVVCVVATPFWPDAAFYMIPTRAWELLIGSMLALQVFPESKKPVIRESIAAVGMMMIIVAVFTYSSATAFPGYAALLPVVGAAMIIHSAKGTAVGQVLSLRILVFLGLISYSLYLWHWPVIVFANAAELLLHPSVVVAISVLLAYLTWKFVENPFRSRSKVPAGHLLKFFAASSIGVVVMGMAMFSQDGFPNRYSKQVVAYDEANDDISPNRNSCHSLSAQFTKPCTMGSDEQPTIAIWADSHGVELSYALGEIGKENGWSVEQITASACPPALKITIGIRPTCLQYNNRVLNYLENQRSIEFVVITAYFSNQAYSSVDLIAGLRSSISALEASGKRVILIAPHPVYDESAPTYLANLAKKNGDFKNKYGEEAAYLKREEVTLGFLRTMEREGKIVVWPASKLCKNGQCFIAKGGQSLYFDKNHLSMVGARIVAPMIANSLPPF